MIDPEQTTTDKYPDVAPSLRPPSAPASAQEALVGDLAEQMADAWCRGDRLGADHSLGRHPGLGDHPSAVMDLLYEEIRLRHEYDEPVDVEEIIQRFPKWRQQIEILIPCVYTLETGVLGGFPVAGDMVGDFQLLTELGRGGQGRVFVATQSSLGGRPVVLKISTRGGQEHLSLARLQHTHIVPLLSVLDDPDRNLRVLCMPYYGGLTLAAILTALKDRPQDQRAGQHILELLDQARAEAPVALPPSRDPATPFLGRASYIQAISWLGACLAEALKYAHERGLVHLDLKPSNVLLTADRQPMLLDFHLAREPVRPGDPGKRLGGTPLYMSPEQKNAIAALREGSQHVAEAIDGRSDIYSLGLVLHEALGGGVADADSGSLMPLRRHNPLVPAGLSDIIAKCLAGDSRNRYRDAGALAADLWGHLNDLPLRGVANRSLAERWRKWRRRKPHLVSYLALCTLLLVAAGAALAFVFVHVSYRVAEARQALTDGQEYAKNHKYADAASALERGLAQLEKLPGNHELKDALTSQLEAAARGQLAQDLNQIVDRFRVLYGVDVHLSSRFQVLAAHCQRLWEQRSRILDPVGKELDADVEQRIRLDLLDLAILGTNLRVKAAGSDRVEAARREALRVLDEAEALFGASAVLCHERRAHTAALRLADTARTAPACAAEIPCRTAWEHYAMGRALMQDGDLEAAAAALDRAVAIEREGLWPNFYLGICQYRLGRFVDASYAFTVCTTLAPRNAGCIINRALAFVALGQSDRALRDFDTALELDPELARAALHQAAAELQHALSGGAAPASAHFQLALINLAQKDRASAMTHLERSQQDHPQHAEASGLLRALRQQLK